MTRYKGWQRTLRISLVGQKYRELYPNGLPRSPGNAVGRKLTRAGNTHWYKKARNDAKYRLE